MPHVLEERMLQSLLSRDALSGIERQQALNEIQEVRIGEKLLQAKRKHTRSKRETMRRSSNLRSCCLRLLVCVFVRYLECFRTLDRLE